ncbi:MAG TPA: hypothetical protein ENI60_06855 [Candidatus Fraserbacteria bacterium]|nr:hypothetical protein [Candidatus Fraserbacteria bacterium]
MDARVKTLIEDYLQGLLATLEDEAQLIWAAERARSAELNLQGSTRFDGSDQATMRALAYLLEILVKRRLGREVHLYLDANGYKERRCAELKLLAGQLAEEVVRERKRVRLNPMAAYERKAVHEALSGHPEVHTYSEGQGEARRVIIEPRE